AKPQMAAKSAPTNGLNATHPASSSPCARQTDRLASAPTAKSPESADNPMTYDMECCGTHQKHRGMPSIRKPPKRQLLIASMLTSRSAESGLLRATSPVVSENTLSA